MYDITKTRMLLTTATLAAGRRAVRGRGECEDPGG